MEKLTLQELKNGKDWKTAVIVFTKDSFDKPYTEEQRSYCVSSDNKYFDDTKLGNSLFGDCLDGTDIRVRLDLYIHDSEKPWKVGYCYIVD